MPAQYVPENIPGKPLTSPKNGKLTEPKNGYVIKVECLETGDIRACYRPQQCHGILRRPAF